MCPVDGDVFDSDCDEPIENESQAVFNETHVERHPEDPKEDDNDIKILIATDIHVGYGEKKKIIENDAINTFEEVLQIARDRKVDMVLLGGDLFHENNPSRYIVNRVTSLLRKYCLNDNVVSLEFISDPSVNFNHSNFDRVNYEDDNLNVGLPVFTIHGNHDDMTGKGLTALDPLHEAGLLNLFGKFSECDKFVVAPILLRKGTTRLALYGIGSQRDDRLARAFQSCNINFLRPQEDSDDWFNILCLHQNRPKRSNLRTTGAFLPESYIPSFFDFVLWGHEHECKKETQYVNSSSSVQGDGFFILQPGSTVATSLTKDEALQKHVFEITIRGRKFMSKPIPLQTVRKMVVDELILDTLPHGFHVPAGGLRNPKREMPDETLIKDKIRLMINEANKSMTSRQPELPLLRLKVTYTGQWAKLQPLNGRKLGSKYSDEVANAVDMLVIRRIGNTTRNKDNKDGIRNSTRATNKGPASVEAMISEDYRSGPLTERLTVLTDTFMGEVLKMCADEEDSSAATTKKINQVVDESISKRCDEVCHAITNMVEKQIQGSSLVNDPQAIEDEIRQAIQSFKKAVYKKDYPENATNITKDMQRSRIMKEEDDDDDDMDI